MFRITLALASSVASAALAQHSAPAPTQVVISSPSTMAEPQRENVRVRGGFSFNGGMGLGLAGGASASFGGRLGVQFNRYFSTYYQATPMVFLAGNDNGVAAGFLMANSLLANVTLFDLLEIGAGPSVDYASIAGCASSLECDAANGIEFGVHSRLALNLGGRDPSTGRRSAFSIGVDVHPIFTPAGTLFLATAGLGGEWY